MTFLERMFEDDVETVEKCRNKSDECYSDVTGKTLCSSAKKCAESSSSDVFQSGIESFHSVKN